MEDKILTFESSQISKIFWNMHTLFVRLEHQYARTLPEELKLTVNEIHIIEAIGAKDGQTMSEIANALHVTMPTLTVSVNRLVGKGFVNRVRMEDDRRKIAVALTEKGEKIKGLHSCFHEELSESFLQNVDRANDPITLEFLKSAFDFLTSKLN